MTTVLPDAAPANWVDRHAPRGLRPWLKLGRFDRPIGIWLLMLPGWQGIALADAMVGHTPNLWLLGLFLAGAALMRTAGCAYNDIVDRDLDAKVARTAARPVASGQISVRAAWLFVVGCSLAGLLILLQLNPICILLGVASLALVAAYPFMKRITWWPQLWLGLTFNWGALLGFAAVAGAANQNGQCRDSRKVKLAFHFSPEAAGEAVGLGGAAFSAEGGNFVEARIQRNGLLRAAV